MRERQKRRRRDPARGVLIAVVTFVSLLVLGTFAAYAYDSATNDRIAKGVSVNGVSVGGLTEAEARARIDRDVLDALRRPVTVRIGDEAHELDPRHLRIEADVQGSVREAMEASREGGLVGRVGRRITGDEVDRDIDLTVRYRQGIVERFVDHVADRVERPAVDARIEPGPASLNLVEHSTGRALDREQLVARVERAISSPSSRRELRARPEVVEPAVTTDGLAEAHPTYITVDRPGFQLHLWKNLELAKTYTIAIGQAGHDTPAGLYSIQNRAVNPTWNVPNSEWAGELAGRVIPPGPENPLKSRWLGIYDGVGIHGTDALGSLGSAASRGCLRMSIPDVEELYEMVPVGTPVYIA